MIIKYKSPVAALAKQQCKLCVEDVANNMGTPYYHVKVLHNGRWYGLGTEHYDRIDFLITHIMDFINGTQKRLQKKP